ncbi:MAG: hypothetical protein FJW90_12795, partial [Actinobacteria bacterium]|nr:hypothetical protein [Actinomycetota bacterium]
MERCKAHRDSRTRSRSGGRSRRWRGSCGPRIELMQDRTAFDSLADAVRSSRLLDPGSRGLALCSGGADSAALLAGLAGACGAGAVTALHLNYGLRPDSRRDEAACAALCERLGVELVIERPGPAPAGNTQAWAREARYEAAERLRAARGLDWIAVGH